MFHIALTNFQLGLFDLIVLGVLNSLVMSEVLKMLDFETPVTQSVSPASYQAEVAISSNPREVREQPNTLPPGAELFLVGAIVGAAALSCVPDFIKRRKDK